MSESESRREYSRLEIKLRKVRRLLNGQNNTLKELGLLSKSMESETFKNIDFTVAKAQIQHEQAEMRKKIHATLNDSLKIETEMSSLKD